MNVVEREQGVGLVELAPELVHKVALSGYLTFNDVTALSKTCRRMKNIFVDDGYGRDIHYALKGVMENMEAKRWRAARYATKRRWFRREGVREESVWKEVAGVVLGKNRMDLAKAEDLEGWENVMLEALTLPGGGRGCLETWSLMYFDLKDTMSLLHVAASVGSEKVLDWALERGADAEVRNKVRNETPLFFACKAMCKAGSVGAVRTLVESGADVMALNKHRRSVLHVACHSGDVGVLRYLLGLGVLDVEEGGAQGKSPLAAACRAGHLDVVKVLVEEGGADVDVDGRIPRGPLFWACWSGNTEVVELLVNLGAGSGVGKDEGVWVAGMVSAAQKGHVDVVRMLIAMGVGAEGVGEGEDTALCCACRAGKVEVVKVLVEEGGADVNRVGKDERTPVFLASIWGREDVVRVLLELGANVGIPDAWGGVPEDLARMRGHVGVVEAFEEWRRAGEEK